MSSGKGTNRTKVRNSQNNLRYPSLLIVLLLSLIPASGLAKADGPAWINEVSASHPGGFHPEPFLLELTCPDPDAEIRYTLDGSVPGPDAHLYTGPILITDRSDDPNDLSEIMEISHRYAPAASPFEKVFKGTVVRAQVFRDGVPQGPVMTDTWFIHKDGHGRYSFPVISIITDRDHFFDHETGIYVLGRVHGEWVENGGRNPNGGAPANYNQRGDEWERPAHITMFETDGSKAIDQGIGIRVHGGWSRAFPQKSLRLYARSIHGNSRFRYRFFPHVELDDFNRLILRQSGQDVTATMFRDVFTQESVRHMNFDIQHFRPAVVFLNGEYWGIYNIRQRYDRHYFEAHYGVGEDDLDLLTTSAENPKDGDNTDYLALRAFIRDEDMSLDEHYELVRTQMDIDNFIDYLIANIFADNTDWPHNNIDYWRMNHGEYRPDAAIPEQDGRWRWVLVDTDFGFGWYSSARNNTMTRVTGHGRQPWANTLLNGLLENETFKNAFYNRFADMLNTTFQPDRMTALLDSLKAIYAPEITEHINRRGNAGNWPWPLNYEQWKGKVNVIRNFAEQRPGHMWRHLYGFDQQDTTLVTLHTYHNMGTVHLNSIPIEPSTEGIDEDPWPWSGSYFSDIPITVTAVAHPGHEFLYWTGGPENPDIISTEKTIEILPAMTSSITAVFQPTETSAPIVSDIPADFRLYPNYPNPFNSQTVIRFTLPEPAAVHLDVFDVTGRHVARLLEDGLPAGYHQVVFDAGGPAGLAGGVYLYRLDAGRYRQTRKMTLIR